MGTHAYRAFVAGIVVLVAVVIGALWYSHTYQNGMDIAATTTSDYTLSTTTPGAGASPLSSATTSAIKIALLDITGASNGISSGCDKVVMVDRQVPATSTPLSAALRELFSLSTTSVDGWFNFIDRTNATLAFDHATIATGTANVYLTGALSGLAGVCDDPRAAAQIEETAHQFPTVKAVKIFLNGVETNLIPSEKG
jgi:hypothetical protein